MLRTCVIAAATMLVFASAAHAQTEPPNDAAAQPEAIPAPEIRRAIPRSDAPRREPASRPTPAPRVDAAPPPSGRNNGQDRDRGQNRRRGGIYAGPPVYNHYYSYPRRSYPYGYGAFGLGYFYYDPYAWYPGAYSASSGYGYGGYGSAGYGSAGYGSPGYDPGQAFDGFDVGALRLRVTPRHAQVFVDGYYAGEVDDYDGIAQAMKLESGPYHIKIEAPGYEPLEFDVRIIPEQKIQYRGELKKQP